MLEICATFPGFVESWNEHLAEWGGKPAGSFNDINVFAHFIDCTLFEHGNREAARQAFLLLERLFLAGNQATRTLIGIGFIEDIANISSWRGNGHATVFPMLPPTLVKVWGEIEGMWAGKSSLMEVIDAEKRERTIR